MAVRHHEDRRQLADLRRVAERGAPRQHGDLQHRYTFRVHRQGVHRTGFAHHGAAPEGPGQEHREAARWNSDSRRHRQGCQYPRQDGHERWAGDAHRRYRPLHCGNQRRAADAGRRHRPLRRESGRTCLRVHGRLCRPARGGGRERPQAPALQRLHIACVHLLHPRAGRVECAGGRL